jgi:hypothetical protein
MGRSNLCPAHMVLIYWAKHRYFIENMALFVARKEADMEVNTKKTAHVFKFLQEKAGQSHNIRMANIYIFF